MIGKPELEDKRRRQWHVECRNESGQDRTLIVSIDDSHQVFLGFPPNELPALTIKNVLRLSSVLASALSILLSTALEDYES